MSTRRDCYEVLGVGRDADASAIKKAYRKLARKYHPDNCKGDASAEKKFKEITEAYDILNDSKKREIYDKVGYAAFDGTGNLKEGAEEYAKYADQGFGGGYRDFGGFGTGGFGTGGFGTGGFEYSSSGPGGFEYRRSGPGGYEYRSYSGSGFEDLFGDLFHSAGDRRGQSRTAGSRAKGQDVESSIRISFDESIHGCDKTIRLSGSQGPDQTLEVHIPAGITPGKKIRLKGKGNHGPGGDGDLYIKVEVDDKPGYERKGNDLYTTIMVPYVTAVLGGEADVTTPYGDVRCKIKPGTQSGSKLRIRGKGVPVMGSSQKKGDLYASVQIKVPRNVSPKAAEALRQYEKNL